MRATCAESSLPPGSRMATAVRPAGNGEALPRRGPAGAHDDEHAWRRGSRGYARRQPRKGLPNRLPDPRAPARSRALRAVGKGRPAGRHRRERAPGRDLAGIRLKMLDGRARIELATPRFSVAGRGAKREQPRRHPSEQSLQIAILGHARVSRFTALVRARVREVCAALSAVARDLARNHAEPRPPGDYVTVRSARADSASPAMR